VLEFKLDDIYNAPAIGRQIEAAAAQDLIALTGWNRTRALPSPASGAGGHVYYHRADRLRRRAEHTNLADHDGNEKTRDIAVLVSMVRAARRYAEFHLAGLLIGIIGTALGLVIGYTLAIFAAAITGYALGRGLCHRLRSFVPRAIDAVLVAVVSLAISFIATVYPSQSAAQVLPAEALRYE